MTLDKEKLEKGLNILNNKEKLLRVFKNKVDLSKVEASFFELLNEHKAVTSIAQEMFNDTIKLELGVEVYELTYCLKSTFIW